MSRSLLGGVIATVLLASTALAAEPLPLSDAELDALTAGATSGALIFANANVPGAAATATSISDPRKRGVSILPLSAAATAANNGDSAEAEIAGTVVTIQTAKSSLSFGRFIGDLGATGSGGAEIGVTAQATGDHTSTDSDVQPLPSGDFQFTTFAAAFDRLGRP